jgi:geranylgeranyl pyrophosphate synthase
MVREKAAQLVATALKIGALIATVDDRTGKRCGVSRRNGGTTYLTMAYPEVDTVSVVRSVVENETGLALQALRQIPPSDARAVLAVLAGMLVEREY